MIEDMSVVISQTNVPLHKSSDVKSSRLLSLDVFRGVTIAAMILVNNAGDEPASYWPLQHAHWNGWTPTDLIFPFFLFIVGVAMAFSFSSRQKCGASKVDLLWHILWRGAVIFAIGLILNGSGDGFHLSTWRIYGVLQRIAICYVVTAILALFAGRKTWIVGVVACLAGYWILMRYIPVPGFGIPGRDIPLFDPDRNIVAWLDRKLLMGHLYEGTRDPEGLLSTIPAIATSLLGLLTGDWLRSSRAGTVKAQAMAVAGMVCLASGEVLAIWFPINKKLWTSSFVVFTAGMALVCLAFCYVVLDVRKWRGRWVDPILVFGMNAIAAYVFAGLLSNALDAVPVGNRTLQECIYQQAFSPLGSPAFSSLLYSLSFVLICWLAMLVLYRKGIFLKV
jgi:predicted acyltransferase